jgi:hypothetical protein
MTLIDPRTRYSQPDTQGTTQAQPGLTQRMDDRPDHDEQTGATVRRTGSPVRLTWPACALAAGVSIKTGVEGSGVEFRVPRAVVAQES